MTAPILPPIPGPYAIGQTPTADELNDIITLLSFAVLPTRPIVSVRRTTAFTLATTSDTVVTWEQASTDTNGMWNSANPGVITCKQAGLYLVLAQLRFAPNGTGLRATKFMLNTTSAFAGFASASQPGASTGEGNTVSYLKDVRLVVNDVLRLNAWQNSGGNLDLRTDFGSTTFTAIYMGP